MHQDTPAMQCAVGGQLFIAGETAEALPLLEAGFATREQVTFAEPDDLFYIEKGGYKREKFSYEVTMREAFYEGSTHMPGTRKQVPRPVTGSGEKSAHVHSSEPEQDLQQNHQQEAIENRQDVHDTIRDIKRTLNTVIERTGAATDPQTQAQCTQLMRLIERLDGAWPQPRVPQTFSELVAAEQRTATSTWGFAREASTPGHREAGRFGRKAGRFGSKSQAPRLEPQLQGDPPHDPKPVPVTPPQLDLPGDFPDAILTIKQTLNTVMQRTGASHDPQIQAQCARLSDLVEQLGTIVTDNLDIPASDVIQIRKMVQQAIANQAMDREKLCALLQEILNALAIMLLITRLGVQPQESRPVRVADAAHHGPVLPECVNTCETDTVVYSRAACGVVSAGDTGAPR